VNHRIDVAVFWLTCFVLVGGCRAKPEVAPPGPPVIPVSRPVERTITDYVDFTGRTNAIQSVDIRARVSGYLVKMPFKEGAEVNNGDLLFEVDPRPYKAQLDQAEGQVTLYKAQLQLAKANYARDQNVAKTPGAVSLQQLDPDNAAVAEADAAVKAFQASVEVYKLNLSFTKATAPVDGQVSRYYLTLGNLVVQDQTLLTTIVSVDPMYVYFDMDEPTVLRIRRAINEGQLTPYQKGKFPVFVGLQSEEGFPHQGIIDFVNNQVNPSTGSISVRGVVANPRPPQGVRVLSPGMFVRVRLPIGRPHPALLVIDRAVSSDQGLKFVYVIDDQHKAQYRRIVTGSLQEDGLRVINDGLKPSEWVVVNGLQQVRPRIAVQMEQMPMPSYGPAAGGQPPPGQGESKPQPPPTGNSKKQP
jgi:multidrug efflux system membrane fusion protein